MARLQAAAGGVRAHRVLDAGFFADLTAGGSVLTDGAREVPALEDVPAADRDQPPTYVPNRNMVLLALAAAYAESAGIGDVFYGAQRQDEYGYWDCTPGFVDGMNAVLAQNRREPVRIRAPFIGMRKAEEIRLGLELGVDFGATWSCYRGRRPACGACPTCVERLAAFKEAGVPDPLAYA